MISDDEYLERVVAGINAVSSAEAEVRWNEVINGRQFDVAVRFRVGTLNYLVLIEVKNRIRRASASDVEAFVIKASDQLANKAVFVTSAGFQEGALTVARRHGIDLFTVAFDEEEVELSGQMNFLVIPGPAATSGAQPELIIGDPELVAAIEDAHLVFVDGQQYDLPNEASQMTYYVEKTALSDGRSLSDLMMSDRSRSPKLGKTIKFSIFPDVPICVTPPDDYYFPEGLLERVDLEVTGRTGRMLSGNIGIEPSAFRSPVVYKNILTGETTRYSLDLLPLNTDPLVVGRFYFQLHPLRYLHCAVLADGKATWQLIESFQHTQLVRGTFCQDTKYGIYYIPVTDKEIIARLERRLADYLELSGGPTASSPKRISRPGNPPKNPRKGHKKSRR